MLEKEALSTRYLTVLLGVDYVSSVIRRADREGWQSLPRAGRGGGKRWIISSMPPATRDAIASAMLRVTGPGFLYQAKS